MSTATAVDKRNKSGCHLVLRPYVVPAPRTVRQQFYRLTSLYHRIVQDMVVIIVFVFARRWHKRLGDTLYHYKTGTW